MRWQVEELKAGEVAGGGVGSRLGGRWPHLVELLVEPVVGPPERVGGRVEICPEVVAARRLGLRAVEPLPRLQVEGALGQCT